MMNVLFHDVNLSNTMPSSNSRQIGTFDFFLLVFSSSERLLHSSNSYTFAAMEEIRNKIKESALIAMDLGDYKPNESLMGIDIAEQLWQGLILKEKDFRLWIKENDWSAYENKCVFIGCSADAIIPTWAYMLVSSQLIGIAKVSVVGTKVDLEKKLIQNAIEQIDIQQFKEGRIIIKGCADISSPEFAMCCLLERLQPIAKSIMYGEPCSTVPVFKRR
jgi:hypothetical protein